MALYDRLHHLFSAAAIIPALDTHVNICRIYANAYDAKKAEKIFFRVRAGNLPPAAQYAQQGNAVRAAPAKLRIFRADPLQSVRRRATICIKNLWSLSAAP